MKCCRNISPTPLNGGSSLAELIRRPELNYEVLAEPGPERPGFRQG